MVNKNNFEFVARYLSKWLAWIFLILCGCGDSQTPEIPGVRLDQFPDMPCKGLKPFNLELINFDINRFSKDEIRTIVFPYPDSLNQVLWVPEAILRYSTKTYQIVNQPTNRDNLRLKLNQVLNGPTFRNQCVQFLEGKILVQEIKDKPKKKSPGGVEINLEGNFQDLEPGQVRSLIQNLLDSAGGVGRLPNIKITNITRPSADTVDISSSKLLGQFGKDASPMNRNADSVKKKANSKLRVKSSEDLNQARTSRRADVKILRFEFDVKTLFDTSLFRKK